MKIKQLRKIRDEKGERVYLCRLIADDNKILVKDKIKVKTVDVAESQIDEWQEIEDTPQNK